MQNNEIREEIKAANLRFWQVAEKFGLNDGNFSRRLRHELSDADKTKIREIIADLSKEELRKLDPQTPVSLSFIRRLVKSGAVPSVPVGNGNRRLLNFDALCAYLENPPADEAQTVRGIRPVDERW